MINLCSWITFFKLIISMNVIIKCLINFSRYIYNILVIYRCIMTWKFVWKKKMLKIQKNRNKINVKYNKDFRIRNNEEIAIQFWNVVSSVSLGWTFPENSRITVFPWSNNSYSLWLFQNLISWDLTTSAATYSSFSARRPWNT